MLRPIFHFLILLTVYIGTLTVLVFLGIPWAWDEWLSHTRMGDFLSYWFGMKGE